MYTLSATLLIHFFCVRNTKLTVSYLGEAKQKKEHKMMPENDFAIIDISTAFRAEKINFPSTTVKLFSPERSDGFLFLFSCLNCMRNLTVDYFCEWSFVVMITTVVVVIKCTRNLHRIVFRIPAVDLCLPEFHFYFWVEIGAQKIIINLLDC